MEKGVAKIGGRNKRRRPGRNEASLLAELRVLRAALRQARELGENGEEDFTRVGLLIARLSDSIARVQLARQRLELGEDKMATVRAGLDDALASMGLGAQEEAAGREEGEEDD